jgi:hypothetical protein
LHNVDIYEIKVTNIKSPDNYFIKRDDRTTAAEIFYQQKRKYLFDELVKNMPYTTKNKRY